MKSYYDATPEQQALYRERKKNFPAWTMEYPHDTPTEQEYPATVEDKTMTTNNQPTPPAQEGVDLEAIMQRVEAAAPGEWIDEVTDIGQLKVLMPNRPGHDLYLGDMEETCAICHANARFIAAARQDVPALVAELRSARGRIKLLQAQNKVYSDFFGGLILAIPGSEPSEWIEVSMQPIMRTAEKLQALSKEE